MSPIPCLGLSGHHLGVHPMANQYEWQVRHAHHRHFMYSASKTSHRVALHLPHNPAGFSTLAGALLMILHNRPKIFLAVWRTCLDQGIRRLSKIQPVSPLPTRVAVPSNLRLPRMNTMEDDVTRCPRSRAQTKGSFLPGPTCPWSTVPYQESHVSHAVILPGLVQVRKIPTLTNSCREPTRDFNR